MATLPTGSFFVLMECHMLSLRKFLAEAPHGIRLIPDRRLQVDLGSQPEPELTLAQLYDPWTLAENHGSGLHPPISRAAKALMDRVDSSTKGWQQSNVWSSK